MTTQQGYVTCAHVYCSAIFIGREGDLCEDCAAEGGDKQNTCCDHCDNDRVDPFSGDL